MSLEGGTLGVATCTVRCQVGFHPSKPELVCVNGEFSGHSTYSCLPDSSCDAPTDVPNANTPACAEGKVSSGKKCTPVCVEPYVAQVEVWNTASKVFEPATGISNLTCQNGTFVEYYDKSFTALDQRRARFRCYAMCQSPTGIDHAHEPVCDPSPVPTGGVCVPRCMSGYFPSSGGDPVSPRCVNGELFPATFQCLPYSTSGYSNINACPVKSLETSNANRVPCAGLGTSGLVVHGTRCVPQCKEGYETDVEELICQSAIFNPGGFKCRKKVGWWSWLRWVLLALLMLGLCALMILGILAGLFTDIFLVMCYNRKRKTQAAVPDSDEEVHAHRSHHHHHPEHHHHHHHHSSHHRDRRPLLADPPAHTVTTHTPQPDYSIVDDPKGGEGSYLNSSPPTHSLPPTQTMPHSHPSARSPILLPPRSLDDLPMGSGNSSYIPSGIHHTMDYRSAPPQGSSSVSYTRY